MTVDPALEGLDVYLVGGAVRDRLMSLPVGDRDWVVVGASPEQMLERGFTAVGADFPVFLHPQTKEEYALARSERKQGRGYKGFTFYTGQDVTLEQDLLRRDLTVNAIAQDLQGQIHDPYGGVRDIENKTLRHVSEAFAEDPVRILRLARFLARFIGFSVDAGTHRMCEQMVQEGEADALVPERVWQEISRGLMYARPSRMLKFLEETGTLACVAPGLHLTEHVLESLDLAADDGLRLPARSALMCSDSGEPKQILKALRAPANCQDYAQVYGQLRPMLDDASAGGVAALDASQVLEILQGCDAFRKAERFFELIKAWAVQQCAANRSAHFADAISEICSHSLTAMDKLDFKAIADKYKKEPRNIKPAVEQMRLDCVKQVLKNKLSSFDMR